MNTVKDLGLSLLKWNYCCVPAWPVVWLTDNGPATRTGAASAGEYLSRRINPYRRGDDLQERSKWWEEGRRRREDERNEQRGSGASANQERCDVKESDIKRTCCGGRKGN